MTTKQEQVITDVFDELYETGYARTTNLDGYQNGDYSQQLAARMLKHLKNEGWIYKENEYDHTYYPTDRLTQFSRPEL